MSEHPEYVHKERLLRAETTEVERLLWSKLNRGQIGGWRFRRQYPIGRYFADFACLEARLVIELDGSQHADDQLAHDEGRDAWIRAQGFKIVRFWNIDVQQNLEGVLTKIIEQLESISLDPANPSPQLPPAEPAPDLIRGGGGAAQSADEHWMRHALKLAHRAADLGEVPVGAVLVKGDDVIAEGWNQPVASHDPSAHAEMVAMREAARTLKNYRLNGLTLYVTLEPCVMCAGAIIHARLDRLVFGAADPKGGAVNSVYDVISRPRLNHRLEWTAGVLEKDCGTVLQDFFRSRRKEQRA